MLSERVRGIGNRQSGNGRPLAPRRISVILALEVEEPSWLTGDPVRTSPLDPSDQPRKSIMGSSKYPRGASEARHRRRADQCRQVPVSPRTWRAEGTGIPGLADVSPQPRRRYRRDGSVRGVDHFFPAPLRIADHGAWPAANAMARGDRTSDCGVDRQSARAGHRPGETASISPSGS